MDENDATKNAGEETTAPVFGDATLPKSNPEVIENFREAEKESLNFDPDLHAVDKDGNPKLTADGKFQKKRGRKKGVKLEPKVKPALNFRGEQNEAQAEAEIPKPDDTVDASLESALLVTEAQFMVGRAFFGEDGEPIKDGTFDEYSFSCDAWKKYLETKNVKEVPPSLLVFTVLSSYVTRRMAKPEPRKRVFEVFKKAKKATAYIFGGFRKKKKDKDNYAHINNRQDGDGQDNASETTGQALQRSGG